MSKHELRQRVRAALNAQTPADHAAASASIVSQILSLDVYRRANVVMLFAALPDEPDLAALAQHALATGKTVLAPRVDWSTNTMAAAMVQHWPGDLEPDIRGLRSPRHDAPAFDPESIHLVLVPGVAFDAQGHRLGRGKGFYDRFLPSVPLARRIGVAFAVQRVLDLPHESHDQAVARVVTD